MIWLALLPRRILYRGGCSGTIFMMCGWMCGGGAVYVLFLGYLVGEESCL